VRFRSITTIEVNDVQEMDDAVGVRLHGHER